MRRRYGPHRLLRARELLGRDRTQVPDYSHVLGNDIRLPLGRAGDTGAIETHGRAA